MKKLFLSTLIGLSIIACKKEEIEPEIVSVKITNPIESIEIGKSHTFKFEYADPKANPGSTSWMSSDPSIISVSDNGVIKAVDFGSATITLRMVIMDKNGQIKEFTDAVTVKSTRPDLQKIKIIANTTVFKKGDEVLLVVVPSPDKSSTGEIEWSSSDAKIASVSNGRVKCLNIGKTVITAKVKGGNISDTYEMTVVPQTISSISFKEPSLNLTIGETKQTTIIFTPSNVDNKKITYTSSDKNVATVDENGVVTARNKGKAVITAKSDEGGKIASCNVDVIHFTDKITMSISGSIVNINGFLTATVGVALHNNSGKNIHVERFVVESSNIEVYHEDVNKKLENGKELSCGVRLNSVYSPVFRYIYTVDGVKYNSVYRYSPF